MLTSPCLINREWTYISEKNITTGIQSFSPVLSKNNIPIDPQYYLENRISKVKVALYIRLVLDYESDRTHKKCEMQHQEVKHHLVAHCTHFLRCMSHSCFLRCVLLSHHKENGKLNLNIIEQELCSISNNTYDSFEYTNERTP